MPRHSFLVRILNGASFKSVFPLVVMPLALTACVSSMTGGELIQSGVPTGTIVVQNASSDIIDAVTVSTCSAMSHGFDRLPDGVALYPGQSWSFEVSEGCYDVMAGYGTYDGYASADFLGFTVYAYEPTYLTVQ